MEQAEGTGEKEPKIRRGRVDSLDLYEITDYELDVLATGSPSSVFLNFAIFLLSVASSFLVALFTTTISSNRVFSALVIVVSVGFVVGLILLCLWYRSRKSTAKIIRRIKERIPAEEEKSPG